MKGDRHSSATSTIMSEQLKQAGKRMDLVATLQKSFLDFKHNPQEEYQSRFTKFRSLKTANHEL